MYQSFSWVDESLVDQFLQDYFLLLQQSLRDHVVVDFAVEDVLFLEQAE